MACGRNRCSRIGIGKTAVGESDIDKAATNLSG
jgi:hypothetical protein